MTKKRRSHDDVKKWIFPDKNQIDEHTLFQMQNDQKTKLSENLMLTTYKHASNEELQTLEVT